jgi:hypothetical protein
MFYGPGGTHYYNDIYRGILVDIQSTLEYGNGIEKNGLLFINNYLLM